MPRFCFTAGSLADAPVSAAATIEAPDLQGAKSSLAQALSAHGIYGAPDTVLDVLPFIQLQVRITPEAVDDDENWEELDG